MKLVLIHFYANVADMPTKLTCPFLTPTVRSEQKAGLESQERAEGGAGTSEGSADEDACPICLQNMESGETLVICRGGCNNKLHHDCMKTCEYFSYIILSVMKPATLELGLI